MKRQWQELKAELQEKPMLALSLALVGVLVWLYLYLWLLDEVDERKRVLALERSFYNELVENAADDSVFLLRDRMASTLAAYRELARRGTSEGILQAAFSDDIRNVLARNQLNILDINLDIRPPSNNPQWPSELRIITARVSVSGDRQAVFQSWIDLSERMPEVWFESMTIGDLNAPMVEWQMSALFVIESQRGNP